MKTLILILFSLNTVVLSAQSLSLQRVFVGEYDYQNVPESISFTSYKFQYGNERKLNTVDGDIYIVIEKGFYPSTSF